MKNIALKIHCHKPIGCINNDVMNLQYSPDKNCLTVATQGRNYFWKNKLKRCDNYRDREQKNCNPKLPESNFTSFVSVKVPGEIHGRWKNHAVGNIEYDIHFEVNRPWSSLIRPKAFCVIY